MKRHYLVVLGFAASLFAACSSSAPEELSAPPAQEKEKADLQVENRAVDAMALPQSIAVWATPDDLSTSIGDRTPLRVGVRGVDARLGSRALGALSKQVRLVTWPEGEEVASSIQLPHAEAYEAGQIADPAMAIQPNAPLLDRWYALEIVDGQMHPLAEPMTPLHAEGGRLVARFRPGSESVLRQVRVCGATTTLIYSEEPKSAPQATVAVGGGLSKNACSYVEEPESPARADGKPRAAKMSWVRSYACHTQIATEAALKLSLVGEDALSLSPEQGFKQGDCTVYRK
jgi:hypothetical protein